MRFEKYQATGNDFVIIDKTIQDLPKISNEFIRHICDRRFGIGADGAIFIDKSNDADFDMFYYNSDGSESFCGNGSRAAVDFAKENNFFSGNKITFNSNDGLHEAAIFPNSIKIKMHNVDKVERLGKDLIINTGSPHYIIQVENTDAVNVVEEGRKIRFNEKFMPNGTNVNFIQKIDDGLRIRTYERGVEAETLSCGTGATACALATQELFQNLKSPILIEVKGGNLKVYFERKTDGSFKNIWLEGPAKSSFKGEIEID